MVSFLGEVYDKTLQKEMFVKDVWKFEEGEGGTTF